MLPAFVIGLREGVEAALIVGIIAAFLNQEGRRDALKWTWLGVGLAVAICLAIGIVLQILDEQLPQKQQEGLETVVAFLAVGLVTWMILWMRRNARGLSAHLRQSAGEALAQGSVSALVLMAFFAVIREGLETAVFLLAAFQNASNPTDAGIGAVLGIACACVIGVGIYRGGVRINLQKFFRFTGLVLVLVAAGLVANGLHSAHEAGWIDFGQAQVFDLSWLVVPGSWTASLLTGMLGWQPFPVTTELAGYLVFLVPVAAFVLWPQRRKVSVSKNTAVVASLVVVCALALAACGSGSSKAPAGSKQVSLKITDKGCEPAALKLNAGPTRFSVTNAGTSKVSELEVLQGSRVVGEKENLIDGFKGSFDVTLQPGSYAMSCPGGTSQATGTIAVGGKAVHEKVDPRLQAATVSYASYVETQARILTRRTTAFVAAVKAGDMGKAKRLFAAARSPYETIEPVAESFGTLDPDIDARVNDVKTGDAWTGFHRIEKALWTDKSLTGMTPIADKLLADVERLQRTVRGLSYKPEELTNGANGLLDEVSSSKITGEEDRYSHTDLSDFEANVSGSQTTFGLLAPALRAKDAALEQTISARFDAVQAELSRLKGQAAGFADGNGYPDYSTVGQAERKKLSLLVSALAKPLAAAGDKLT